MAQGQVGTGVQAARQRRVAWRCTETHFTMSKPALQIRLLLHISHVNIWKHVNRGNHHLFKRCIAVMMNKHQWTTQSGMIVGGKHVDS